MMVSLSGTKYFEGVPRIPKTVLDAHREGLILGSACSEGEVFDAVMSQGVDAAVEVAKYYDFIEVMPPAIYAPLIAKEQVKDMDELQTIIKSLIEVGDRLGKPVLATGNVHYLEPEDEIYREIIVRSLDQALDNGLELVHVLDLLLGNEGRIDSRSKWSRGTSIRHLSTRPKKRLRN